MLIRLAGLVFDYTSDSTLVNIHLAPFETVAEEEEEIFYLSEEEIRMLMQRLTSTEPETNRDYIEEMALLWAVNNRLICHHGFFLHAAVVALDQKAVAFTAPSGTGKTTHTRLWLKCFGERAWMINGDKPFIRRVNGQWIVFPNPWNGKEGMGSRRSAPLHAICFLERSTTGNRIRRIEKRDAIARLFSQTVVPQDADGVGMYLSNISDLINEIPCYQLACDKTDEAVRTVWEGIFLNTEETT